MKTRVSLKYFVSYCRFVIEIFSNLNIVQKHGAELKNFIHIFFSALLTPFTEVPFITQEIICCINEAAKGANTAPINPPSWFFISCLTASVTPSIHPDLPMILRLH